MNKNIPSYCIASVMALALSATPAAFADNHEEEDLGMALFSIYGYAPGMAPAELEEGMVQYQKDQEKAGFDNCGLYRHEFGATRGVYTYCYFKDMEQFGKIMDAEPSEAVTEPQAFGQHFRSHRFRSRAQYRRAAAVRNLFPLDFRLRAIQRRKRALLQEAVQDVRRGL
jgi:hypothetical protein